MWDPIYSLFAKIITLAKTQQLGQPVQYDEADIILVLQPQQHMKSPRAL